MRATRRPAPAATALGSTDQRLTALAGTSAQAESLIGLYKLECGRRDGPWRGVDDLELATLGWVHWFNHQRLHSKIGYVTPVEHEDEYYRHTPPERQPQPGEPALH